MKQSKNDRRLKAMLEIERRLRLKMRNHKIMLCRASKITGYSEKYLYMAFLGVDDYKYSKNSFLTISLQDTLIITAPKFRLP